MKTVMTRTNEVVATAPADLIELVRGNENTLVELMTPLVREKSTVLDLGHVHRIDAAGIAALISIYSSARKAGQTFRVRNVTPHVAEILKLVGLDHILLADSEDQAPSRQTCVECTAA